ncbi:MAG: glucose-1-phosphate cytidylyltransferase [Defluviitaleaceae bacterium]|nr:glucose-1-phosphate cytidylyltransferase [Defluviitaleaceae bacterium]
MKVVILAGGFGTRISEESDIKPKPMIEIGGKPILWHIMKLYSSYGFNEFIICCGYKQYAIKEYFANYYRHNSNITIDLSQDNVVEVHSSAVEPWKVTMIDTGLSTMTGGRIKKIAEYINDETFMLTYGDGVSDVNLKVLLEYHKSHGKIATITAFNVGQQFGILDLDNSNSVIKFREKSDIDGGIINAGYMVLNPEILDYIDGATTVFEKTPLERVAAIGQLKAFIHHGFWKAMDTLRDKQELESMIESKKAPWMIWEK